jgi:hypothetical protein
VDWRAVRVERLGSFVGIEQTERVVGRRDAAGREVGLHPEHFRTR